MGIVRGRNGPDGRRREMKRGESDPRHAMLTNIQSETDLPFLFNTSLEVLSRLCKKGYGAKSDPFYMTQKCFDK